MQHAIFISYRRTDSQHATFAIADRLRWAFGPDHVFLDRGSIRDGNDWPETLRSALGSAKVLIAVIGPAWLSATDKWGRRRVDDRSDWVRQELLVALERRQRGEMTIVPVALDGAPELASEAVDRKLASFPGIQCRPLRAASWEDDVEHLVSRVAELTRLPRLEKGERNPNGSPARPRGVQARMPTMSQEEIHAALAHLARWHLQWVPHAWGAGGLAQEIAKSYDFTSFQEAVRFMADAALEVERWDPPPHHPRWENQWREVTVAFSTWDVDCRVTRLDIEAATRFDAFRERWRSPAG